MIVWYLPLYLRANTPVLALFLDNSARSWPSLHTMWDINIYNPISICGGQGGGAETDSNNPVVITLIQ